MNISIIGASAGVGLAAVQIALNRGHKVTTLSRSEIKLEKHQNLITLSGSATNKTNLKNAIAQAEAIIVTLGTGMNANATTLYTDFAKTLLEVHSEINITVPVIILTGFGAGDSANYQRWILKPLFAFVLNKVYKNKTEMERIITESSLNWEIVRPGVLTNKTLTEKYRVVTTYSKGMNIGSISRNDVADYMVKQAENPMDIKKYPALSLK